MIKMKVNQTKALCISNYNFERNYSNKHQKIVIISSFLNQKKCVQFKFCNWFQNKHLFVQ